MFRNRRFTRKLPLGALLTLLSQAPFFLSLFLGGHSAVLMGVQLFTNLHLLRHFFFFFDGGRVSCVPGWLLLQIYNQG